MYEDVVDGWYRWTASNARLGLRVTGRVGHVDLGLGGGVARTGGRQTYLLLPGVYATTTVAWRW